MWVWYFMKVINKFVDIFVDIPFITIWPSKIFLTSWAWNHAGTADAIGQIFPIFLSLNNIELETKIHLKMYLIFFSFYKCAHFL